MAYDHKICLWYGVCSGTSRTAIEVMDKEDGCLVDIT